MNKSKNILVSFFAFALIALVSISLANAATADNSMLPVPDSVPPCGSYGDVNFDGFVTQEDAEIVLDITVGKIKLVSATQMKNADVDGDGTVTAYDSSLILRYAEFDIDMNSFPVCRCTPEGEMTNPSLGPGYWTPCCEGLEYFNPNPYLIGAPAVCYDLSKGEPVCRYDNSDSEGWYYPTGELLMYDDCTDENPGDEPGQPGIEIIEVKEQVKCVFDNANQKETCYSDNGDSCTGYGVCNLSVKGLMGEVVKWKSTCGRYAYTTIDGNSEYAVFQCEENEQIGLSVAEETNDQPDQPTVEINKIVKISGEETTEIDEPNSKIMPIKVIDNSYCKSGCMVEDGCVPIGVRLKEDGTEKYCDITKKLFNQKDKVEVCQNNYECLSNQCADGECTSLSEELGSFKKFLSKLFGFLNWGN